MPKDAIILREVTFAAGGKRKCVNIGVELLANPNRLFLDEAASGLDPGTEGDLIRLLRELAETGKTIVLTTHSMEYLDRMDQLVVLQEGHVVFAGSLPELREHFQIGHASDMFKRLRSQPMEHWRLKYTA